MELRERIGWGLFIALICAIISVWTGIICSIILNGKETNSNPQAGQVQEISLTLPDSELEQILEAEKIYYQYETKTGNMQNYFYTCIYTSPGGESYRLFISSRENICAVPITN